MTNNIYIVPNQYILIMIFVQIKKLLICNSVSRRKIYENEEKNKINVEKTLDIDNDIHLLTKAKKSYQCGEYQESMNILSSLMEKYKDYKELNSFILI